MKHAGKSLVLTPEASPAEATKRASETGLDTYNEAIAPCANIEPLRLVGRDGFGDVQAGLCGTTLFEWLFVQWLWVAAPIRRQSIGSQLRLGAETIARERLCTRCYLDTFSFQAPEFYERHGLPGIWSSQ